MKIARIWQGRTKVEHLKEYENFMKVRAIPDYKKPQVSLNYYF
jgi:hypothetical protein